MRKPVQERTIWYSTGAAGTPNHGFDSRWRYNRVTLSVESAPVFRCKSQRLASESDRTHRDARIRRANI